MLSEGYYKWKKQAMNNILLQFLETAIVNAHSYTWVLQRSYF